MDAEVDRFDRPEALAELLGGWMDGGGPLYRKLAAALHGAVLRGELAAGDRLPAERALAAALAVSRATVVAAYDELRARGLLESRRGSGTRIAAGPAARPPARDGRVAGGRATALVQRLVDGADDGLGGTISLAAAGEGAADDVREALAAVLADDLDALLAGAGYHPGGLPALRDAVAARFTALGLPTARAQVLITTGATQGLALAAQMHLRRGATAVVESPGWPGCLDALRAAGARIHGVPLDDEGVRVDGLAAAFARGPALLYTMPTYHNPTGTLMSAARRRRIAALAAEHRVPVVEDLAYDTRPAGAAEPPPPIAAFAPPAAEVLSLGSLTKAVWSGLRVGWVRGPAALVERLARFKAVADLGTPVLDQALAARLLPRLDAIAAARAPGLRDRLDLLRALLAEELPDWRVPVPDGGSALWARLPDGADARAFAQLALRHGVEVVPGAAADPSGAHDDRLRLPYTLPPDRLRELARRLATAWAAWPAAPRPPRRSPTPP